MNITTNDSYRITTSNPYTISWPSQLTSDYRPFPAFTPQGWICPKCGRVWSPSMPSCLNCNQSPLNISSGSMMTIEEMIEWGKQFVKDMEAKLENQS